MRIGLSPEPMWKFDQSLPRVSCPALVFSKQKRKKLAFCSPVALVTTTTPAPALNHPPEMVCCAGAWFVLAVKTSSSY